MGQDIFVSHHKVGIEDEVVQMVTLSRKDDTSGSKLRNETTPPIPATSVLTSEATMETVTHNTRTTKQKRAERIQLMALFLFAFLIGWNDGSNGPLLPRIQEVYHVGFTVVSMIFVCVCTGFIVGALLNFWLTERLAFGKIMILGSGCQVLGLALQAPAPPFPVFVLAFAISGFGVALQLSQAIGLVIGIKRNGETKMGIFQSFYGLGALSSPFAATQFAQMRHWSFHYLISLGIAMLNMVSLSMVFGSRAKDDCLKLMGEEVGEKGTSERSPFSQVFRIKAVHYLAFFVLFYVGVEVSLGGWIVTFMVDVRGGGPSSGYISSGFFAGLMLGRLVLLWVNKKLGERLALFCYTVLAIALELIVWLVPSLIGGAVAVGLVGLLLGPMYPIAMNQAGRILPAWLTTSAIGWISGFGQSGSAALPFLTGAISSKHGIRSLQPLLIAMMGCMLFLWYLVPTKRRD